MSFSHHSVFLFFSAFAALVSVGMWLDYFRRIDVFEKEKLAPLIIALLIGGCTPYLSLTVYRFMDHAGFSENGRFWHDLLYSILGIGLNEELCKLLGVMVTLRVLKKYVDEPIDVLVYAGVTALGFSMVENYHYFNNHGIKIITSRTFYSALEHIINTSIIVYGIYRQKLFKKGHWLGNTLVAMAVAVASHGLFDFFLLDNVAGYFTAFLSIGVYLVGINFWIQMLNNANNYSAYFSYDKIHHTNNLVTRLFTWYVLTLLIAFINNALLANLRFSFITLFYGLVSDGFLFFIVILRVSRFKIFHLKYFTIRPEFPFYITRNKDEDFVFPFINVPLKIRGESHQEYFLTRYLNRRVELYPVDKSKSFLNGPKQATITGKLLLHDDVVVYTVTVDAVPLGTAFVLKPKTSGRSLVDGQYPIEGLCKATLPEAGLEGLTYKNLELVEWVYVKPLP